MEVLGTAATLRTGFARRAAARPGRADAPRLPDPDLRRRHQRGPARHHRHGRARPAPSQPLTNSKDELMDFTTTEAAHDLGGLVATIVDSVCTPEHQRELDGLDQRFDRDLWGKLDRRRHPVHARTGVVGRRRIRRARAGRRPGRARPPAGRGALSGVGRCWPRARWRGSDPTHCSRTGRAPAVSGTKILTVALDGEMGEGPVQATRAGDGYRLTGTRTQVGYGPVADALPGARRNRFRHDGFPGRRRATPASR